MKLETSNQELAITKYSVLRVELIQLLFANYYLPQPEVV